MDEVGKGQKANTHGNSVGVDIAVVERDRAAVDDVDVDATSVLPNNKGTSVKPPHRGDGMVS